MYTGTDAPAACLELQGSSQHQPEQPQRYLWRQGQAGPLQNGPSHYSALAAKSPEDSPGSHAAEEEDEALPTSLSGMARHFQAQRAGQTTRRRHCMPKRDSRQVCNSLLYMKTCGPLLACNILLQLTARAQECIAVHLLL